MQGGCNDLPVVRVQVDLGAPGWRRELKVAFAATVGLPPPPPHGRLARGLVPGHSDLALGWEPVFLTSAPPERESWAAELGSQREISAHGWPNG